MNEALLTRDPERIHNFRELASYPLAGGGRIRRRMLYRSGALEQMTDADRDWLEAEINVSTVLDLRHQDELDFITGPHALNDRVVPLSVFPAHIHQEDLIAELNGLYGPGPSPERYLHYLSVGGPLFAEAFRLLANEMAYPVLIHCTAGKDRTGVIVGMLMELLGADDADIADEYALSEASIPQLIAYLESIGRTLEGTREEIYARLSTPPERMAGFTRLVRERYGGAEAFLLGEGVTAVEIARLRELLTASE